MAGIINKIGDALHVGGNKEGGEKKYEQKKHASSDQHKKHKQPEHKKGIIDQVKDKIGGGGNTLK